MHASFSFAVLAQLCVDTLFHFILLFFAFILFFSLCVTFVVNKRDINVMHLRVTYVRFEHYNFVKFFVI